MPLMRSSIPRLASTQAAQAGITAVIRWWLYLRDAEVIAAAWWSCNGDGLQLVSAFPAN